MNVPLFATSLEPYRERIAERLLEVAASGRYILGPEVDAFEREFADYLGVRHVVGVGNGTDALTIALRALGVGAGDEVICPSLTFYATAEAIVNAGARPVFCDVDPDTACVTADDRAAARWAARTKAIVPVHLFGNVAPVPELSELGVPVLEDAAQAAGASLDGVKAGRSGRRRHVQLLPVEEPALPRRRRRDRHRLRRGGRPRADAALPRLARQADAHRRGLQLAPRLDPGGRAPGAAARARRLERRAAARRPRRTSAPASASWCAPLRADRRGRARVPPLRGALRAGRRAGRGPRASAGSARAATTAPPPTGRRRCGATPSAELPATDELARTILALPMGPELSDEQVAAVVEACGARAAA